MKFGRFLHRRSGDPDGCRQRGADQEGDAPAPALQAGFVHQGDGQCRHADRQQRADLARRRGQRRDQAAPVRRRAFEQIGDDAGIFAADREAHHAAEQEQQPAGRGADLRIGRKRRRRQHRRGHQRDGDQQHPPAPGAVADMAEIDRAERTHEIGDGEAAQGGQQRHLAGSEEDPRQDGREIEIEGEIIPFDDGREGRDRQRTAGQALMFNRFNRHHWSFWQSPPLCRLGIIFGGRARFPLPA